MGSVNLDKAILTYKQFQMMVAITMAYPRGFDASSLNPTIGELIDLGMIRQKATRFYPTEAGVNHIMPSKFQKRA